MFRKEREVVRLTTRACPLQQQFYPSASLATVNAHRGFFPDLRSPSSTCASRPLDDPKCRAKAIWHERRAGRAFHATVCRFSLFEAMWVPRLLFCHVSLLDVTLRESSFSWRGTLICWTHVGIYVAFEAGR